jgi:hypothetical protein
MASDHCATGAGETYPTDLTHYRMMAGHASWVAALLQRKLCRHGQAICPECIAIGDAAKRMSNIINALITFTPVWELRTKWLAIRLQDGGYDGTLYDTREDAIRHQLDERFCAYVCMAGLIQGAKPLDCAIFLEYHRQAYDAGMRLHEPEAPQLIMPTSLYDRLTGRARDGH